MEGSPTTFDAPVVDTKDVAHLKKSVTIYASGSVSINDALNPSQIILKSDDIKEAIGVGADQFIPPLASASVTHYFNPTSQRLGITVRGGSDENKRPLVENAAMARNPTNQKMEGFTAVIPSTVQGNLNQRLAPHGSAVGRTTEMDESMSKWRGLKTADLTDGVLETKMSDGQGGQTVVKYDVPIVRSDGSPQPLAYMLEKNREQFPGFRGDEIGDKIHEYDGLQYYAVPPKYVHFLIGSMQDNLIDKSGWALDGDLTIDITPLSPILSPNLRKAPESVKADLMERMIAIEVGVFCAFLSASFL